MKTQYDTWIYKNKYTGEYLMLQDVMYAPMLGSTRNIAQASGFDRRGLRGIRTGVGNLDALSDEEREPWQAKVLRITTIYEEL